MFEITERNGKDLEKVNELLVPFFDSVEKQYKESIQKGIHNPVARGMGLSKHIENSMPFELAHIHYIETDKIIVKNNLPKSRIMRTGKMYDKMKDGLYRWLRDNGYECEIKIKGE
jgi:hypothetical protein